MRRFGIQQRVLVAALLPAALLALALASFFIAGRMSDVGAAQSSRAWALARQLAAASEYGLFSGNSEALDNLVRGAKRERDLSAVAIFDANGRSVVRSGDFSSAARGLIGAAPGEVLLADSRLLVHPIRRAELPLDELFDPGEVALEAPPLGRVVLEFSLETTVARERELMLAGILMTLGGLLFGNLLAWYLSRSVIRRLRQVGDVVEAIGAGDLSARVAATQDSVLRQLSDGINLMVARLQGSQEEMQRRIAAATAEARKSQEAYRLIAAEQQAILNTELFGIASLHDRVILWANPGFEKILGYAPGAAVGVPTRRHYVSEEDYRALAATAYPILAGGGIFASRVQHLRQDGRPIWVDLSAVMMDRQTDMSLWAFIDVSERVATEAALVAAKQAADQANLSKTRFLAAASHDLWQPIQAINLFHDALHKSGLSPKQEGLSQKLTESVRSLGDILSVLVEISRLDAGVVKPQYEGISAEELFYWIDSLFSPLAFAKKLRFKLYFPVGELAFGTDPALLHSLLGNLIGNAIRYTERGGVLVGVRRRGQRALIQVWDTGVGIDPAHIEDIFLEYFQVANQERDRAKGLGLGLAIVKRLSELLQTPVAVRSHPGRGTLFEVSLPLAASAVNRDRQ